MLKFEKLNENSYSYLKERMQKQMHYLTEYSLGFVQMWEQYLDLQIAIEENSIFLRAHIDGQYHFFYPLLQEETEEAEDKAFFAIESYCKEKDEPLYYVAIPKEKFAKMAMRYGASMESQSFRNWKDYLYLAKDFQKFEGKKYSGQRNHINKFKKNYPNYQFATWKEGDLEEIEVFLNKWAEEHGIEGKIARAELAGVFALLPKIIEYDYLCGILRVEGEIAGFALGERCGDCLIIHAEKALRGYQGIYPTLAQLFAQTFATEGIMYLNREDDAGQQGLRKSKLQYLPVRLVDKYSIHVKRAIDYIHKLPKIKGERILLKGITERYAPMYTALAKDVHLNQYWGYDYREEEMESPSEAWFFQGLQNDFIKKMEMPLGIYYQNQFVGQVVLHKFGYQNEVEIGMRILPKWQGRGFAKESLLLLCHYAFFSLGIDSIKAKAHKENVVSIHTLQTIGMKKEGEDEKFIYFTKSAAM